jgi:ankyrin repeat protein
MVKVVSLIQENPGLVYSRDETGNTPLHWTTTAGPSQKTIAEFLLAKGADVNAKDTGNGWTPLNYAIWNDHKDLVELFLAKGADVASKDNRGETLLNLAVLHGRKDFVKELLQNKADVNAKDNQGATPLLFAFKKDVMDLLLAHGAEVNSIYEASAAGDVEKARALLKENPKLVATRDERGLLPLDYAVRSGKTMAELLIANGADVNATDAYGDTPLYMAVAGAFGDVAEMLISKGADVNAKNLRGETALKVALQQNNSNIAELLRQHGAQE